MIFAADYPFLDIILSMLVFVAWVAWFWMLVIVIADVFGRRDLSGWGKAGWTAFAIILPFLGVLTYLVVHGSSLAERRTAGYSVVPERSPSQRADGSATEIEAAKRLLDSGAIDQREFEALKHKALLA
jgi:hypothetical protein